MNRKSVVNSALNIFGFEVKKYGNERYLSPQHWRKIIKKSNCKIIGESSYHYLSFFKK